jgi:hypothetical protein
MINDDKEDEKSYVNSTVWGAMSMDCGCTHERVNNPSEMSKQRESPERTQKLDSHTKTSTHKQTHTQTYTHKQTEKDHDV